MKGTRPLDNDEILLVVARFGWQITMDSVEALKNIKEQRYRRWIV